jgi:hypothetical protein
MIKSNMMKRRDVDVSPMGTHEEESNWEPKTKRNKMKKKDPWEPQ